MAPDPTPAQLALAFIYLGALSLMLGAWAWAIGRVASGRGLLPPTAATVVPWRGKHVVGMVALLLIVRELVIACVRAAGVGPPKAGDRLDPAWMVLVMMAINLTFLLVGP